MKKYTLHLISFKQRMLKDKKRREITEVNFYDGITFDLAKFLAIKESCGLIFFDKKNKPCFNDSAVRAIGYTYHSGNGIVAIIKQKHRIRKLKSDISIYPYINKVTLSRNMIDWCRFDSLLDEHEGKFSDYSIEAFNVWGPNELIPKGYEHVTEGEVIEGDFYFKGHWINTNVSFTPIKIGAKIKQICCKFSGKHIGRGADEVLRYYNQFIIRKKSKPV